ncbi:MAG: BatD family protein [Candidatus Zixiibacteriota bacterium]
MRGKGSLQFSVISSQRRGKSKRRTADRGQRTVSIILAISFLLSFSLFLIKPSFSQDISFNASVDKTEVRLDDQITLTISVSGNVKSIPRPQLPSLEGFTVYSAGRSQNFTYSGGKIASSVTFNYILVPREAGKFTIGSAEIALDGKIYKTDPINITVGAGEKPESAPAPSQRKSVQKEELRGKDLFIETVVDKKKAYVNEQITLTFRFFQGVRLFKNPEYIPPSLTGFWAEDLPPRKQYYKVVNGRQYFVQELKTALFPTAAGRHTIGEAELKCTVEDLDQFFRKDPFRMFDRDLMSLFRQGRSQILRSKPIQIEVLPLPEMGRPENFGGTVGDFKLKVSVDKKEVQVGEPITLKMKLSGTGNVKSVGKPKVPELKGFRIYDSGSSENISKKNYLVRGVKTYEMVLIPKKAGKYNIPPLEFSFFDPKRKNYKTLRSDPILITALPGAQASPAEIAQLSKQEIGYATKDIRYIKLSESQLKDQGDDLYKNPLFLLFQVIPLLAFVVAWRYQKHQEKINSDIGYARTRRAHRFAKKRLGQAKKLIATEKSKEFYAEAAKSMIGYVGDKLNLPAYGLTKDRIELELSNRGIEKEKIDNLLKLLDSCDYARFAPGSSEVEEMKRFLSLVEKAIVDLEK